MTAFRLEATGHTPEERFRALFVRHYAAVYRYTGRRVGAEEAADTTAEAFTVAWRKIAHVPPEPDTLPWLYGVARRVVGNARRSRRRRERLAARAASGDPATTPAADAAGVLAVVEALRPDDRELLRLAAWEGLGPREMGAVLGCSPNAAAIRLHRARRRLEEAMRDTGGEQ